MPTKPTTPRSKRSLRIRVMRNRAEVGSYPVNIPDLHRSVTEGCQSDTANLYLYFYVREILREKPDGHVGAIYTLMDGKTTVLGSTVKRDQVLKTLGALLPKVKAAKEKVMVT